MYIYMYIVHLQDDLDLYLFTFGFFFVSLYFKETVVYSMIPSVSLSLEYYSNTRMLYLFWIILATYLW